MLSACLRDKKGTYGNPPEQVSQKECELQAILTEDMNKRPVLKAASSILPSGVILTKKSMGNALINLMERDMRQYIPIVPTLQERRQEDCKLEVVVELHSETLSQKKRHTKKHLKGPVIIKY